MRVDNVNQSKKIGYIKFNTDVEMDLIGESMDWLIAKQKKLADKVGDKEEIEKLERFKKSKDAVIEIPKQNKMRLKAVADTVKERNDLNNKNKIIQNIKPVDLEDTEEFKKMSKVIAEGEIGSGLGEGTEVTHRNMHVLVNALNEHIWEMEKDDVYKKTRRNRDKYDKLKQLLEQAQEQKSKFERHTQKPRGWGRLRK